uniref:Apolipoprotein F n=1 Tax=Sphenodon punctatus TaxID=8508 RepID=A0A8D0GGK8_SPHPU
MLFLLLLLLCHGLQGHRLHPTAPAGATAGNSPTPVPVSYQAAARTLLSSVSQWFPGISQHRPGLSCQDLLSTALPGFSQLPPLPQTFIRATLVLALQGAGCSRDAEAEVLQLYTELGVADVDALLLTLAGKLGPQRTVKQHRSKTALKFNLDQLAPVGAWRCRGLARLNGSALLGQTHSVHEGFLAAAVACRELGDACAGVAASNSTRSFHVVAREGGHFLQRHGAASWVHRCWQPARNRRSASENCTIEQEQQAHAVIEWVPLVSTLYNVGTTIYYAASGCPELAKERGIEAAMDLGYDALVALTGGAGGVVGFGVAAGLKPGVKAGVRALINYFSQEEVAYPIPTSYSGSVLILD